MRTGHALLLAGHPATAGPPVAGYAAWYDASDTSSITSSSGAVSQWNDKSGNGRHLTQSTAGNKPTTGSRTQNSLNVIEFVNDDHLDAGSNFTSGATAGSIFIVKLNDVNSISASGIGLWQIGGGQDSWSPFNDNRQYEWFGTNTRKDWAATVADYLNAHIYGVVAAASDFKAYINASQVFSTGTNTVSFSTTPKFGTNGSGGRWLDGWIGEIVIYLSALGTTDRQSVEAYLKAKWNTP